MRIHYLSTFGAFFIAAQGAIADVPSNLSLDASAQPVPMHLVAIASAALSFAVVLAGLWLRKQANETDPLGALKHRRLLVLDKSVSSKVMADE